MSSDRFHPDSRPFFADTIPRCRTTAIFSYMGRKRKPFPDEAEAIWVIDCLFGGRLLFVSDLDHPGWFIVQQRP